MNVEPGWLVPRPAEPPPDQPIVPAAVPAAQPRRLHLRSLRHEVRSRLLEARAIERLPPERFGFSVPSATRLFMITSVLYRWYFRTRCFGLDNLPGSPFMLVSNHASHVLSWDGANIVTACLLDAEPPRLVHAMAEHRLMGLPILGRAARRIGAVDGTRPACVDLLRGSAVVLTFPEGVRALARPFRDRYRMAPFGLGFVHVALETGVPIVPVAVIGAEEEAPLLANPAWLRRLLRTPVAPITPTLFVPLPVRYRLHFGTPLRVSGPATPDCVAREAERVRRALEDLIRRGLARREHLFF
jgi:1-acyl-sn-glycerol-3-phosphate acyltransferase